MFGVYLERSQKSVVERFFSVKIVSNFQSFVNYFCKKAPS